MADFHKPAVPGPKAFADLPGGTDPAELSAAGHRIATLLVRGAHDRSDVDLRERVLHLADTEGIGVIAELWSHATADSLPGALWRLYILRAWVHRQPDQAAREFAAGKAFAPVDEVLAGVHEPPGPQEVIFLVDTVVGGIVASDFDVTLTRAAAFAQIVAVGRGQLDDSDPASGARLMETARALYVAAALERSGQLS
jgi:hypothetical protein